MRHSRSRTIVRIVALALFASVAVIGGITMDHNSAMEKRELTLSKLGELDKSEYGGYYLDDDGTTIHVNLLSDHPVGISDSEMVKTHLVKYSLKRLEALQDELGGRMRDLHIQSLFVNTRENKLEVHVYQADVDIDKRLQQYAPDSDMYKVVWDKNPIVNIIGDAADLDKILQAGVSIQDGAGLNRGGG